MAVTLTEAAAKHVQKFLTRRGKGVGLRLGAHLQEFSRGLIHCHYGGFVEHDALSLHIHQD